MQVAYYELNYKSFVENILWWATCLYTLLDCEKDQLHSHAKCVGRASRISIRCACVVGIYITYDRAEYRAENRVLEKCEGFKLSV